MHMPRLPRYCKLAMSFILQLRRMLREILGP